MTKTLKAGLIQLCSGGDVAENVEAADALIREAAKKGAEFVLTPENTALLENRTKPLFEKTTTEEDSEALKHFTSLARELGIWLLVGSIAVRVAKDKLANRSFLISPKGIAARYDKIHMFDVNLPGGEDYRESKNFRAGEKPVLADTPWGGLGMSVCYDLRFPYLYRRLAQAGAVMLSVPSAFTKQTGKAHWHVLLRARAIETGCFILAPAQAGTHTGGRETFGHTLAVDPWGQVLLDAGTVEKGAFIVTLNLADVKEARARIPALEHGMELES